MVAQSDNSALAFGSYMPNFSKLLRTVSRTSGCLGLGVKEIIILSLLTSDVQ